MDEGPQQQASLARFLRKKQKQEGVDEQEQEQDKNFRENFQKTLKNHSKKAATKDVEKQIEYFGYKIEPFNMKQQEQMGEIDEQGFFLFNNRKRMRDAWVDSLNDNDGQEAIDTLRKKIKLQQRQKTVFEAARKYEQDYKSEDQKQEEQNQQKVIQEEIIQKKDGLQPKDIKMLLCQLLPFNTSANQYMKKLKKQKNTELYDKILFLCNEYIEAVGQHDILTLKKEDLEEEEQQEKPRQQPINNWDQDSEENEQLFKKKPQKKYQDNADEDDIF